jgi:hypothetical protein
VRTSNPTISWLGLVWFGFARSGRSAYGGDAIRILHFHQDLFHAVTDYKFINGDLLCSVTWTDFVLRASNLTKLKPCERYKWLRDCKVLPTDMPFTFNLNFQLKGYKPEVTNPQNCKKSVSHFIQLSKQRFILCQT